MAVAPLPEQPASLEGAARSSELLAMPLLRVRERVALLRRCALFSGLGLPQLQSLAHAATERELGRYTALRPDLGTLSVLVYGGMEPQQALSGHNGLTLAMPTELLSTCPDAASAAAAAAVAGDAAVAGAITEAGATLGLECLVGPLHAATPPFHATTPSLLLQMPVALWSTCLKT